MDRGDYQDVPRRNSSEIFKQSRGNIIDDETKKGQATTAAAAKLHMSGSSSSSSTTATSFLRSSLLKVASSAVNGSKTWFTLRQSLRLRRMLFLIAIASVVAVATFELGSSSSSSSSGLDNKLVSSAKPAAGWWRWTDANDDAIADKDAKKISLLADTGKNGEGAKNKHNTVPASAAAAVKEDKPLVVVDPKVRPERGQFENADVYQTALWKWYLANVGEYDAGKLGITPKSRGIVMTSSGGWINHVILATLALRDHGCKLPIQLSYIQGQVDEQDLEKVRLFNVTTVDISEYTASANWTEKEMSLGAPKVDAILATPWEQVLFLDPDVMVLRDPEYLFNTKTFKKYGALFWGDTMRRNSNDKMWEIMELQGKYSDEQEFESGEMFFDKSKAWKGLMLTKHISAEAQYYFQFFWGDKEAFHWGFKASNTPYYINPIYLQVVGMIVDDAHPKGGVEPIRHSDGTLSEPPDSKFCGIAMLQLDFPDDCDPKNVKCVKEYKPNPVFMHHNGLKYTFHKEVLSFAVAKTYIPEANKFVYNYEGAFHEWIGDYKDMGHCITLRPVKGLTIRTWDWESQNKGYSRKYVKYHRVAFTKMDKIHKIKEDFVQREKWMEYVKTIPEYNAKELRIEPGSRGIVMTGSAHWVNNVVLATLAVRETGCQLPIAFAYLNDQVSQEQLDKLTAYNISLIDITDQIKSYDWTSREMGLGGVKVDTILSAPWEEVLFLDPDVMVVRNPTEFFESHTYKRIGALFWPDFMARNSDNVLWEVFNLEDQVFSSQEVESGQIFVNKKKVWKGLKLTQYMAKEARYFFNFFWGDKETFFWGFKATNTEYFMNPHYIHCLGVIADDAYPRGGRPLIEQDGKLAVPDKSKFCCLTMGQLTFHDPANPGDYSPQTFKPEPAFLHWNGVKYAYHEEVDPFQVAKTYIPEKGKQVHDYNGVFYDWIGNYKELGHCIDLPPRPAGLTVKTWNYTDTYQKHNALFHKLHKKAYSDEWKGFKQPGPPAADEISQD